MKGVKKKPRSLRTRGLKSLAEMPLDGELVVRCTGQEDDPHPEDLPTDAPGSAPMHCNSDRATIGKAQYPL